MRLGLALGAVLLVACSNASLYPATQQPAVRDDRLTIHGSSARGPAAGRVSCAHPLHRRHLAEHECHGLRCPIRVRRLPASPAGRRRWRTSSIPTPRATAWNTGSSPFKAAWPSRPATVRDSWARFTASSDEVKLRLAALNVGVGETNYVGALDTAYEMLQQDMIALDATRAQPCRYVIVFISGRAAFSDQRRVWNAP